ncbi:MAG: nucleotidyltransferase family protein [Deinococcota bacterium]|nr:nucleotidyltransferase family protein [Deinococcota bacterium]
MRRNEALELLKALLPELRERFGVQELYLFGSTGRDEAKRDSDVDVLVAFRPEVRVTLFRLADLQRHLETAFGCKVDLVLKRALRPELEHHILKEAVRAA